MSYELSETMRRLDNLVRVGTVAEADYARARIRVRTGDLVTDWIPWATTRAGGDRSWWAPELGEQVLLLAPGGQLEDTIALPALYQDAHDAPQSSADVMHVAFGDGAFVTYDRAAGKLTVNTPGQVEITAAREVEINTGTEVTINAASKTTINSPDILLNGDVVTTGTSTVQKVINAQNGIAASGSGPGGGGATVTIEVPIIVTREATFGQRVSMGATLDVAGDITSGGSITDADGDGGA